MKIISELMFLRSEKRNDCFLYFLSVPSLRFFAPFACVNFCKCVAFLWLTVLVWVARTNKKESWVQLSFLLVRVTGLEPAQPCDYKNLNLTRLPVPPHPHV